MSVLLGKWIECVCLSKSFVEQSRNVLGREMLPLVEKCVVQFLD